MLRLSEEKNQKDDNPFNIGSEHLQQYLTDNVRKDKDGSIVTIRGPRATFKTIIAQNFLLQGLKGNENVLLITLGEQPSVKLISSENDESDTTQGELNWLECRETKSETGIIFKELSIHSLNDPKRIMRVYKSQENEKRLTELTLKGGALLPEELLEFIRDIFRDYYEQGKQQITRVVLDDVALIGASYPFLRASKTSGDLFLPAFVHIMKNYRVNLLITGTTGQMAEADEMVNRACELANSVLTCAFCDVFGDRYVTISGDGMHSISNEDAENDYVPGVVRINKEMGGNRKADFEIDTDILKGLVGFGTPHIYRPGLRLYTFSEGKILDDYNKELQAILSSSLGISWQEPVENQTQNDQSKNDDAIPQLTPKSGVIAHSPLKKQDISVVPFDSSLSGALHDSLDIIQNRPLDSTVVYTIDEFWLCPDLDKKNESITKSFCNLSNLKKDMEKQISNHYDISENFSQVVPFYGNVMLIAYRNDINIDKLSIEDYLTSDNSNTTPWEKMSELRNNKAINNTIMSKKLVPLEIDSSAPETISCLMLDVFSKRLFPSIPTGNKPFDLSQTEDSNEIRRNFKALSDIMSYAFHNKIKNTGLRKDAVVYICWYSQLRELINDHPDLSKKLSVCSMPGGGIRGDWYLGVAKGSVSFDLGKSVINILTSKKEQYKRFALGVGLPTFKCFLEESKEEESKENEFKFYSWPHGNEEQFRKIVDIHKNAHSRMDIEGYKEFRPMLYTVGKQLISPEKNVRMNIEGYNEFWPMSYTVGKQLISPEKNIRIDDDKIKGLVGRIQAQYEILTGG